MSEIVTGIQVIKMYTWEKPFEKIVREIRNSEISAVTNTSYCRAVLSSWMIFLTGLSLFLTLTCYTLLGNQITAEVVFPTAQCFTTLQMAFALYLPLAVSSSAEALAVSERLERFLTLEEREDKNDTGLKESSVNIEGVSASWTNDDALTLRNITLRIPPGTLCAIVGPVGSGKSSVLQV